MKVKSTYDIRELITELSMVKLRYYKKKNEFISNLEYKELMDSIGNKITELYEMYKPTISMVNMKQNANHQQNMIEFYNYCEFMEYKLYRFESQRAEDIINLLDRFISALGSLMIIILLSE